LPLLRCQTPPKPTRRLPGCRARPLGTDLECQ
jgi:hypothetical protein